MGSKQVPSKLNPTIHRIYYIHPYIFMPVICKWLALQHLPPFTDIIKTHIERNNSPQYHIIIAKTAVSVSKNSSKVIDNVIKESSGQFSIDKQPHGQAE
jgi:hypothetical protein